MTGTPTYHRAGSIPEAIDLLDRLGEGAHVIAGGQSLVVLMNLGLAAPAALVDIDRLPGLSYLRPAGGGLRVGALTRHAEVERWTEAPGGFSVLPQAAAHIAYPAIRERGTFAGVLAHADPTGEWCVVTQLLDAELLAVGQDGERVIPAASFFVSPLETSVRPGEIIVEVRFPPAPQFAELRKFEPLHPDFPAIVTAAAYEVADDRLEDVRVAVGGGGGVPRRLPEAERILEGETPSEGIFAEAGRAAAEATEPRSDPPGTRYCRRVVATLVTRSLGGGIDGPP